MLKIAIMESENFVASLLLSKASVEFAGEESLPQVEQRCEADIREHYSRLRRTAYFCRASKSEKALMLPGWNTLARN